MKRQFDIRMITGFITLTVLLSSAFAGPIRVGFHDTTIVGGTQFDYPIYIDSLVTGLGVSSYQIEFVFDNSFMTFISARSESTMTASWGAPVYNLISPGRLRIANAGSDTLTGKGKLVIVRFATGIYSFPTYKYFTIDTTNKKSILNQGVPQMIKRDGYVYITPPPAITISPNTWLMTKGETKQFTVNGGNAPYTWSSTNSSVASMNTTTGVLTALTAGFTKVVCVDSAGYTDTSGTIEVRSLALSIRDTSQYQGQTLNLPVYATDATGLGIISGQFVLSYNENLWTPDSCITTGTMLDGWSVEIGTPLANKLNVVFSSSSQLSGSGILLYIRMKATHTTYGSSHMSFINPVFNETILANSTGGTVSVMQLAPVNVTPSGTQTLLVGDSLQFFASGGTGPYTWSVSDTSRASISSSGWLKAKKSGAVTATAHDAIGATGNSGTVNIFDFRLSVPDTLVVPASVVDIPLLVTPNTVGFTAVQMKVTYTTNSYVQLVDVISAGTLTNGWSTDYLISAGSGTATIAASTGSSAVTSGGKLLILRFAVPDSTPKPSIIYINLSNVVFNQGIPQPLVDNGYFTIADNAVFNISPLSGIIETSAIGEKDSTLFTVRNTGTAMLTSSLFVSGSGEFTVSTTTISVPPLDSIKIMVYFQPVDAGDDTAEIHFSTNDPYHLNVTVQVIGKVLLFPVLSLSSHTIDFGAVKIGQWKDTTVTITNAGTDTLKISSISATNGVFTARPTVISIAPGDTFVDTLRFTPAVVTTYNAWFLLTSNASTSPDTIYVTGSGETSLHVRNGSEVPRIFALHQNYPNPFNPSTVISYQLPANSYVTLKVYDAIGREVATLVNEVKEAGYYSVTFDASKLSSGIYFTRLQSGEKIQMKKMLLLK
ncbi:MAG: cohesin domain-containing protein [Bacteroidota bacterium]